MPALNKQTLINLLIDSPLREPIKINLIDIVNNTQDADLPKVYPTIVKELEIFQKATERRMKLAEETVAKLNEGGIPTSDNVTQPNTDTTNLPPLPPLPPMPPMPSMPTASAAPAEPATLSVPPLDLPPLPGMDSAGTSLPPLPPLPPMPSMPAAPAAPTAPAPVAAPAPAPENKTSDADEAALAEIQKELDALKNGASADAQ